MLGEPMRKLLFGLLFILLSFSVSASHDYYDDRYDDRRYNDRYDPYDQYSGYDRSYDDRYYNDRNYDDRYRYDGYVPDDAYYSHSRYGSPYYDPVIFGGLGNYYYDGYYLGSGHPLAGSRYVPFGNVYRYDLGYSYYGYYGPYYGPYGYCVTGCPGWGAPINRPLGIGY